MKTSAPTNEVVPTASVSMTLMPAPRSYSASGDIPACIRQDMIQQAAYFLAEQRGFAPGHELDDWLTAERHIDSLIRARYG